MPPPAKERKRSHPAPPRSPHDDSDEDHVRPGQAERKRELERNRRNLVNVRFSELEAELRLSAPRRGEPRKSSQDPSSKGKRIDKEAVLKEAAQRISIQRNELDAKSELIANKDAEIDNLRVEKVELRGDKAYLRKELETVRADISRLRADNIHLWQAVNKKPLIKDFLAPDVAKLPADLFMRLSSHQNVSSSLAREGTSALMQSVPVESLQVSASERTNFVYPNSESNEQTALLHSESVTAGLQQATATHFNSDVNYLIYQSGDELGKLFSNSAPVSGVPSSKTSPTPLSQPLHDPNDPTSAPHSDHLVSLSPELQVSQLYDMQSPSSLPISKPLEVPLPSSMAPAIPNSPSTEIADNGPLSDIAPCV